MEPFETKVKIYKELSVFEAENGYKDKIDALLSILFRVSQSLPVKNPQDFFSGENFPLTESWEELSASYVLIKLGMYKQAFSSLRIGYDIGLLSIYWKIKNIKEFNSWLKSETETPRKDKNFWKVFLENKNIKTFNDKYPLKNEIDTLACIDSFIHTQGKKYSNFDKIQREIRGIDNIESFKIWYDLLKKILSIIIKIHFLCYPTLICIFDTDFLLRKFGSFSKIPFCGILLNDKYSILNNIIETDEFELIKTITEEATEFKELNVWIKSLPDLTDEEITEIIISEQKEMIISNGLSYWLEYGEKIEHRLNKNLISKIINWAENLK